MELKYLCDTNAVIYYLQNNFSSVEEKQMDNIINSGKPFISVITELELLSWQLLNVDDLLIVKQFINDSHILELTPDLKSGIVEIRKNHKIKLPDAVAATALAHDLILISHNRKDFKKIQHIKLLDPFDLSS